MPSAKHSQGQTEKIDALLDVNRSLTGKKWVLRCPDISKVEALRDQVSSLSAAQIMAGRGVTPACADDFLNPTLRALLPDPSRLQDMDKAAKIIMAAIENGQAVSVFADYDVDGATSAAQLIRWGRAMGAKFGLYVPDRIKEGYGPSIAAFETLKAQGADLVITVDCGASARQALEAAEKLALGLVVIDHHLMEGEMPPSLALVNPNRADDRSGQGHLAAAGVTFLLLIALNREARRRGHENVPDLLDFLDLAALGTVCDVVPLTGLNRALVRQGLKVMSNTPKPGILALAEIAGITPPFSTYHLGFVLGPRINAGGRIGQADMGARLLSSEEEDIIAPYAAELDRINAERRDLQKRILEEATHLAEKQAETHSVLCVSMSGWHAGVIGIVAGRLKDRFGLPVFVIGVEEGIGKGSGRSIEGVNLGAAVQEARKSGLLQAGGGHAMAAGLTITDDKLEAFHAFLETHLQVDVERARANQALKIDGLIAPSAVGPALVAEIEALGPYGAKMPEPLFALAGLRISFAQRLNGGHVRCAFEVADGDRLSGIVFGAEERGLAETLLSPNPPRVHIAARLKQNTWKGRSKIDLQIKDIAISGAA